MSDFAALVTFAPGADRAPVVRALVDAPEARRLIQPILPGVHDGGDLILRFEGAPNDAVITALAHPAVVHVDSAVYEPIAAAAAAPELSSGVYRILLLAVDPATPEATVRQFEAEMAAMPRYIPAIRNWRLSRVTQAAGARPWTHVWEQEYADLGGLLGAYMTHPYHWARIDRWFDPECPERIVDPRLCHSFCTIERSVL